MAGSRVLSSVSCFGFIHAIYGASFSTSLPLISKTVPQCTTQTSQHARKVSGFPLVGLVWAMQPHYAQLCLDWPRPGPQALPLGWECDRRSLGMEGGWMPPRPNHRLSPQLWVELEGPTGPHVYPSSPAVLSPAPGWALGTEEWLIHTQMPSREFQTRG